MKNVTFTFLLLFSTSLIYSQNNLLLNPMLYNPAIAGQSGNTDISLTGFNILTELQNVDYNGQTLNFSTSIKDGRFGLGGNLVRRVMFFDDATALNGFLAYHKSLAFGQLSVGTSIGVTQNSYDFSSIMGGNASFVSDVGTDYYFNLGLGAVFTSKRGYLGFSTPNILQKERRVIEVSPLLYDYALSPSRQFVVSGGLRFSMFSENLIIRPSMVYSMYLVEASRTTANWTELQLNLSLQLFHRIWLNSAIIPPMTQLVGIDNAVEFGAGYSFKNGFRLGANYRLFQEGISFNRDILEVVLGTRLSQY